MMNRRSVPIKSAKKGEATPPEEGGRLTDGQILLWTGQRLHPELPTYNIVFTFAIEGEVDPAHFQEAIQALIDGADALRTVIDEVEGAPRARVLASLSYTAEYLDWSMGSECPSAVDRWVHDRAVVPLRIDQRMFDTALIKLAPKRFVWYLNLHHLISDGWSYALVYQHVADNYARSVKGELTEAPALPSFWRCVARESAARRPGGNGTGRKPRREEPILASDPLHFYGHSPAGRSSEERRHTCNLGVERTQKLWALAGSEGIRSLSDGLSMLHIFLALVFAYLHRVTGARRLTMGVPFHQRSTEEARATIGLLQDTLPVVVEVAGGDTFADLIRETTRRAWDARRRGRRGSRSAKPDPAFDVMVNYPNISFPAFHGYPTRVKWVHPGVGDGHRLLFLQIQDFDGSGSLVLHFDFNEGIFDEKQQSRAAAHFLHLLDHFLADPSQPVWRARLLPPAEEEILRGFNRTKMILPDHLTVAKLFEAQVLQTPDGRAVASETEPLTYAELNARANQMAHLLQKRGVGPGVRVAVCAPRSRELLVAFLGILKAGAAYVPLDPTYPADRLEFMLADIQAPVLLTASQVLSSLPRHESIVICLDRMAAALARESDANPIPPTSPNDLAYVIYTSGSTGSPKGVAMSQGALFNLICWQIGQPSAPGATGGLPTSAYLRRPRTLQYTPLTFDVSLQETLSTWCSGGTLVLLSDEVRLDPEATLRLLIDAQIERLFIIFTPLQQLAEAARRLDLVPTSLREVITAGERLQITPAIAEFFSKLPHCTLQNQYGPSETHIVTSYTLPGPVSSWPVLPSIGGPIANTQIHILDEHMQPVPLGVPGELYIGGAQVAEGYLHRPELTSERFVADPFGEDRAARLYKTGDRARYLPDGTLQFLGRMDTQVKLRGYRIELGEIEAVLGRHRGVEEAVVLAREDVPGEQRLVAYVVRDSGYHGTEEAGAEIEGKKEHVAQWKMARKLVPQLRRFLASKLPEYMVPSAFVLVDAIPQTPNGKVDRLSLPAPQDVRPDLESTYVAPRSELERAVAAIWQDVLRLDRVGRDDKFFDLGGHSLLLVQVHSRLREQFDCNLVITDLFRLPTVSAVAGYLSERQQEAIQGRIPSRQPLPGRVGS